MKLAAPEGLLNGTLRRKKNLHPKLREIALSNAALVSLKNCQSYNKKVK
jgi:hypothetical protein